MRRRQGFRKARVKKIIFLGLDGLDPRLTERFMAEGKLPNLARLQEQGRYRRLRTTFPALSPVAWSTFATGVSPAQAQHFRFSESQPENLPAGALFGASAARPTRVLQLGRLRIPLSRAHGRDAAQEPALLEDSRRARASARTILRVPITFPPEKFDGRLLSAMCTPDLHGTQGSFSQFTTRVGKGRRTRAAAAIRCGATADVSKARSKDPRTRFVEGGAAHAHPIPHLRRERSSARSWKSRASPIALRPASTRRGSGCTSTRGIGVKVQRHRAVSAHRDRRRSSRSTARRSRSIRKAPRCPSAIRRTTPSYLAKLLGSFATVGMAEDTWALNEGVIDEDAFLEQA